MQLDPKGKLAARLAYQTEMSNRDMWHADGGPGDTPMDCAIRAYLSAAPSPSPAPGAVEALRGEADRAYCRYLDKMSRKLCLGEEAKLRDGKFGAAELDAHREARELLGFHRGIHFALASLSQPAKGEREGETLDDAGLYARLKEIAIEVFPSANKYAVADGVKNIIMILERIEPAEYVVLHRSMYPFSYSAPDADDGQPDEVQEWHDYDPDC